ncbi:unnamed protein product [Coccothraustes coccothraustes]
MRKQRAPLRPAGRRRSRAGPGHRGSSPSCQAEQAGPPGRARQDRAEQAGVGLPGAGQNRAHWTTGIRESPGPSFGPTSAWMELFGQILGLARHYLIEATKESPGFILIVHVA